MKSQQQKNYAEALRKYSIVSQRFNNLENCNEEQLEELADAHVDYAMAQLELLNWGKDAVQRMSINSQDRQALNEMFKVALDNEDIRQRVISVIIRLDASTVN